MIDEVPNAADEASQEKSDLSSTPSVAPIWAITAKIVEESPFGSATQRGTRKFNANQKVYLCAGPNANYLPMVEIIGRYRGKYKYIRVYIHIRYLTRFRAEMVYSPTAIRHLQWSMGMDGSEESRKQALHIAEYADLEADRVRADVLNKRNQQE